MPYIDKETIEKAREIDLLSYLEYADPFELVKIGNGIYKTRTHSSLKISNGKWYWWHRNIGGRSAIDYLVKVKGFSLPEAVKVVIDNRLTERVNCPAPAVKEKELKLPPKFPSPENVRFYLKMRKIDEGITNSLIDEGLIYENHTIPNRNGISFCNAVFVGMNSENVPKYAAIRGIGSNYKGEATGSDKRYSFRITANAKSKHLHLYESAIDLLSYMTLEGNTSLTDVNEHHLSTGGIFLPKKENSIKIPASIESFINQHKEIEDIHLHHDNDDAGVIAKNSLFDALSADFRCHDEPPGMGKDYNDYLISVIEERRKTDKVQIERER